MTDGPLVSVVIPSFNRSAKLVDAIESVRTQTHTNVEILVVDDGSRDDSYEVATRLMALDPRLRVMRHDANRGAQAARNTGIRAAKGEWVAFLDSDDRYLPDSIERRLATARREGTSAVHGECIAQSKEAARLFGVPAMAGDIRRAVLERPGPVFPALLVRSDHLAAIDGLDESIVAYQEWDTAIRLATVARFSFVAEPTFVYDTTTAGAVSRDRDRAATGYEQVLRKHLRQMLHMGGPPLVARHLREVARQRRLAGQSVSSAVWFMFGVIAWPFDIPGILRSSRTVIAAHRGLGEE